MTYKFQVKEQNLKMASFIKEALGKDFSLKHIKRSIEKGACRVNGRVVNYANHSLKKGDTVEIAIAIPQNQTLETVYEDDHFLVVNKPCGLVSEEKDLKKFFSYPIFLVHRLDKETSGLLILAKTPEVRKLFEDLFRKHQIIKRYLAICDGLVLQKTGSIDVPLEAIKKGHHATIIKASLQGQQSHTMYKTIDSGKNASFLEFEIITGKTHQIRAHANSIGHPILGDPVYLKKPTCTFIPEQLCLHAYFLSFQHPMTQKSISICKAPSKNFTDTLKTLIPHAKLPRY